MAHPRFDAQDVSPFLPCARNPDRREGRVGTASDDLDLWEETTEDAHSARCGDEGDEDDAVLSYTVVEKDADSHGTGGTCHYLSIE